MELADIVSRVPWWRGERPVSAGKEIARLRRYRWSRHIECEQLTRGPYRLAGDDPVLPDRDSANAFIASAIMPAKLQRRRQSDRPPRLNATELQAYDLLVQYGVYLPAVVDLIIQRLGDPDRIRGRSERLTALRILVTLFKTRGQTKKARELATSALRLAERLDRKDDIAYLHDQIGGTYHIEGRYNHAQHAFQREVDFLEQWGTKRAKFHLVGAYRGLAATQRAQGNSVDAANSIEASRAYAKESNNEEGMRLALLETSRLQGSAGPSATELLTELPLHHPVALVMALNLLAEHLLTRGDHEAGERILKRAYGQAQTLGYQHEMEKCSATATRFGVTVK